MTYFANISKKELKTIKDLGNSIKVKTYEDKVFKDGFEKCKYELKAENIKILKADIEDLCKYLGVDELSDEGAVAIGLFIIKQNNITEEDLKEKK